MENAPYEAPEVISFVRLACNLTCERIHIMRPIAQAQHLGCRPIQNMNLSVHAIVHEHLVTRILKFKRLNSERVCGLLH